MTSFIVGIYEYLKTHRVQRFVSLFLSTICLLLLVAHQSYKEDISDFLPLNNKYQKALELYQDFSGADRIIAVFECKDSTKTDPDSITLAIADFQEKLLASESTEIITDFTSQIDVETFTQVADFVYANIPYFLTDEDYDRIDSILSDEDYIPNQVAADKQMLLFPVSGLLSENIQRDPLNLFTPTVSRLQRSQPNVNYELYDGYIFSTDMTRAFAMMTSPYGASETEKNTSLLNGLQSIANDIMSQHQLIDVRFFGGPAIAVSNASQIKKDSLLTVVLAIILIVCLLFWVFRNVRNILLIVLSIAWGWLFAMGLLSIFHDNVSVIVIGISSVILGIAVNYPLHLIAHTHHTPDIKNTLKEIVMPLVVGNVTTVGAFLALVPLKSTALRDLGAFAAFLLIGTIVFVLIYLPHFVKRKSKHTSVSLLDKVSNISIENHRWIVCVVIILTLVFGYFSLNTSFDANMSHINYMTPQQQEDMAYFQQIITQSSAEQSIYVVSSGTSLSEAVNKSTALHHQAEDLKQNGLIKSYDSPCHFICSLEEQKHRLSRWEIIIEKYAQRMELGIRQASSELGFSADSFEPFYEIIRMAYPERDLSYFTPVSSSVYSSQFLEDSLNHQFHVVDIVAVDNSNIDDVKSKLEQKSLEALVFDVPSMNSSIATNLSDDFNYIGWACALIVFLFLWFSLGSIELALLSFLPMAISWIWILGIMSLLNIQFNVVNVILATFIFGQGDDYTIFMTEGCQYEYAYGKKMLASYKNSIIVSALIMFIGIGALIFAKHPALHSLAEVTIVGMFSVVLMAYLFPPLIFKWLITFKQHERRRPIVLRPLLVTIYCAIVFFTQLASVYALGFVLFKILRPTQARKKIFRKYIKKCFWLDMNHVPTTSFIVHNEVGEDFLKPAVVICNHQSMLDTAYIMALSDNLIILANQNASNNIIIKQIFKWLDFYTIPPNGSINTDYLCDALNSGYCVAVFPEGERNDESSIKRFHKGAFKLAEMAQVDVVPLYLHGINHVYPRYTVCTYPGKVTLEVGHRILFNDDTWGLTYRDRAREVHKHYVQHFEEIRKSIEKSSFFHGFVRDAYRYRGIDISSSVRKNLIRNDNYSQWVDCISDNDQISQVVVINSGWGEFPLMMSLVNPDIKILAFEDDIDQCNASKECICPISKNVNIIHQTDALHYLLSNSKTDIKVFLLHPNENDKETYKQFNPIIIPS